MGRWGGRHVCRPYMGDLAGVRGNKGNVQRRGKSPPYNMEDQIAVTARWRAGHARPLPGLRKIMWQ